MQPLLDGFRHAEFLFHPLLLDGLLHQAGVFQCGNGDVGQRMQVLELRPVEGRSAHALPETEHAARLVLREHRDHGREAGGLQPALAVGFRAATVGEMDGLPQVLQFDHALLVLAELRIAQHHRPQPVFFAREHRVPQHAQLSHQRIAEHAENVRRIEARVHLPADLEQGVHLLDFRIQTAVDVTELFDDQRAFQRARADGGDGFEKAQFPGGEVLAGQLFPQGEDADHAVLDQHRHDNVHPARRVAGGEGMDVRIGGLLECAHRFDMTPADRDVELLVKTVGRESLDRSHTVQAFLALEQNGAFRDHELAHDGQQHVAEDEVEIGRRIQHVAQFQQRSAVGNDILCGMGVLGGHGRFRALGMTMRKYTQSRWRTEGEKGRRGEGEGLFTAWSAVRLTKPGGA